MCLKPLARFARSRTADPPSAHFLLNARNSMYISTHPLWTTATAAEAPSELGSDVETDVVVIGAGITGLTAATLLRDAGKRVIVLEKDAIGAGETGRTTAHVTESVDVRYHTIRKTFG